MSLVGRKSPSIPLPLVNNYLGFLIRVPSSCPTYVNLVSSAIPRPFQTTGFASNPPQLSLALARQVPSGKDVNHHDNIGRCGPSCGGNVSGVQNHGHRGGVPNIGISKRFYDGQGHDFNAVTCGRNSAFDPRNNLVQNWHVVNGTRQRITFATVVEPMPSSIDHEMDTYPILLAIGVTNTSNDDQDSFLGQVMEGAHITSDSHT